MPYIKDISFSGHQTEFRRSAGNSFGASSQSYVTNIIAGNTFDFPYVHGKSIAASGLGFISASVGAIENGDVKLSEYETVDLILGKQKKTEIGKGKKGLYYQAFPESLQKELRKYVDKGGELIISGQYAASELTDMRSSTADRKFAAEILGVEGALTDSRHSGAMRDSSTGRQVKYNSTLNEHQYIVEKPDGIIPSESARTSELYTFTDNGQRAGQITYHGRGKVALLTVPIESIADQESRNRVMGSILDKLSK